MSYVETEQDELKGRGDITGENVEEFFND